MKTLLLTSTLLTLTFLFTGCFGNKQHEPHLIAHIIEKMTAEYGPRDVVYYEVHFNQLKGDKEAMKQLLKQLDKMRSEGIIRPTLLPKPNAQDEAAEKAFLENNVVGDTSAVLLVDIVKWRSPHEVVVQVTLMETPGQAKGGTMTLINRNAVKSQGKTGDNKDAESEQASAPKGTQPVWQVVEGDYWSN